MRNGTASNQAKTNSIRFLSKCLSIKRLTFPEYRVRFQQNTFNKIRHNV